MIAKTTAYRASDGSFCATLDEAQMISLRSLFVEAGLEAQPGQAEAIANTVIKHRDAIIDLLTTTSKSRPKRRLVNGYPGHKRSGKAKPVSAIAGVADAETA